MSYLVATFLWLSSLIHPVTPIVPFAHPVPEYIEPDPTPIPDWDNPEVT